MARGFQHPTYCLIATGILWIVTTAIPPPPPLQTLNVRSSIRREYENEAVEHKWREPWRSKRQSGNKYKYYFVTQCGVYRVRPKDLPAVEVAATVEASDIAHEKAARLIFLMVRFMPMNFFSKVANTASVGVFASDQVVGDFEEYAHTKSGPNCKNTNKDKCKNKCRVTCTSDGRKYDKLVGYSEKRAVVREDNILCGNTDPYGGNLNVLSHEFAHAIHISSLGFIWNWHALLEDAFAKRLENWAVGYATSDLKEFFAEGTTSYFRTSLLGNQSAEMNLCNDPKDGVFCPDEWNSRENLKKKDPTLFELVDEMYSGSRTFLQGRIGICDW